MPGVSETVARVLVAEIGVDMTRFPGAGHLVSWAGLCPRLDESAGKRRSTRIRHATLWLTRKGLPTILQVPFCVVVTAVEMGVR